MQAKLREPLWEELRELRGIVYEVFASTTATRDSGAMVIEASTDPDTLTEAMQAVLDELSHVRESGITRDQLERAREFIKGEILLSMEDTYAVAAWALREQLLEKEQLTPDAVTSKYDAVTLSGIATLAGRLFTDGWPIVAASGPINESAEIPSRFNGITARGT